MHLHVLSGHRQLSLAKGIKSAQSDARVCDAMLTGWKKLQIVAFLDNRAIICRDAQTIEEVNRIDIGRKRGTDKVAATYSF